jgi:hypothetical protein
MGIEMSQNGSHPKNLFRHGDFHEIQPKIWHLSGVKTIKPLTIFCKWFIFWAPQTAESCNQVIDFSGSACSMTIKA